MGGPVTPLRVLVFDGRQVQLGYRLGQVLDIRRPGGGAAYVRASPDRCVALSRYEIGEGLVGEDAGLIECGIH